MARVDQFLLLWDAVARLCVPHVLLVSEVDMYSLKFSDNLCHSMRYSRMLEESSFANRKADYVWLLILSSIMLLARLASTISRYD